MEDADGCVLHKIQRSGGISDKKRQKMGLEVLRLLGSVLAEVDRKLETAERKS